MPRTTTPARTRKPDRIESIEEVLLGQVQDIQELGASLRSEHKQIQDRLLEQDEQSAKLSVTYIGAVHSAANKIVTESRLQALILLVIVIIAAGMSCISSHNASVKAELAVAKADTVLAKLTTIAEQTAPVPMQIPQKIRTRRHTLSVDSTAGAGAEAGAGQ